MIIDKINEVLPKEFQDEKQGYALTSERVYKNDTQDDTQDAQEVDTSVFM